MLSTLNVQPYISLGMNDPHIPVLNGPTTYRVIPKRGLTCSILPLAIVQMPVQPLKNHFHRLTGIEEAKAIHTGLRTELST
jgi:hypothetical protein